MVSKEKKRNKNLEKMHWSAADPTFQEATDYVMHFLMRQSRKHTVWKSPQKLSFFNFRNFQKISGQILSFKSKPKKKNSSADWSIRNWRGSKQKFLAPHYVFWQENKNMRQFWNDFQPLWFCTEFDLCWQWQSATVEEMGMWGECFIYFFLTFQWSPWRIMWRLWNGCKTVGWWLHLERTMESSKPLIQFCGWTTCKQTTLVFTNALSLLTVDVKFSHLENWGWEVPLLLFPCLIFQFEELLKKSRQILSRNQNINKNSGADWSVRHLRGKTIIKKKIEIEIEK